MIRAKFYCQSSVYNKGFVGDPEDKGNEYVILAPVVCGSEENKSFSKWTPSGRLELSITNQNVFGKFVEGQEYYLDITPAEKGVA